MFWNNGEFQRKAISLSVFVATLILASCGAPGNSRNSRLPVALPSVAPCTATALAGSIRMQTVASQVTANSDVVWEVSATGGVCAGYELRVSETNDVVRFQQRGYFTRRYTTLGSRTERVTLTALTSSGSVHSGPITLESGSFNVVAQSNPGGSTDPLVCEAVISPHLLTFPTSTSTQTTTALIEARRGTTRVQARLLGYYAYGAPVNPLSAVPGAYGINQNVGLSILAPPFEGVLGMLFGVQEKDTGVLAQCAATIVIDREIPPPAPVPPSITMTAQLGSAVFHNFLAVQPGTTAYVSWSAVGASSCSLLRDGSTIVANGGVAGGVMTGQIYAAQTYTTRCVSAQGLVSERNFYFSLVAPPSVGRVDIKANGSDGPVYVAYGANVTISYVATNVTSCSLSALGLSGASASASRVLHANTVYTVTCSYYGGTTSDSVSVHVGLPDYQLLFVTDARYMGDLGGVSGADAKCQAAADAAGVMPGRIFKAVLPSSTEHGRDRIRIDQRVVSSCSGRPELASNAADFWDGRWDRAANCNEFGVHPNYPTNGYIPVWSSMNAYGHRLGADCQGWTSTSPHRIAYVGDANDAGSDHFFDGSVAARRCDYESRLYCISQ